MSDDWIGAAGRRLGMGVVSRFVPALAGFGHRCTGLDHEFVPWWQGDLRTAQELYGGHFAFGGHGLRCRSDRVFEQASPHRDWTRELHEFRWLAHLSSTGLGLYRTFARGLVAQWWSSGIRPFRGTASRRLLSLSCSAGFLLQGASAEFEGLFFRGISKEIRRALRCEPRDAAQKLDLFLALLMASLAFSGLSGLRSRMLVKVSDSLDQVILPDGGHRSRSPAVLTELLEVLWRIRSAMNIRRLAITDELNAAIERGVAMVKLLTLGDGELAGFRGGDGVVPDWMNELHTAAPSIGPAVRTARQSGFVRLTQGGSVVILDCHGVRDNGSGFGFEWSHGAHRVVVSCGCPASADSSWAMASQSVAAHSAVEIGGLDGSGWGRHAACGFRKGGEEETGFRTAYTAVGALGLAQSISSVNGRATGRERDLFLSGDGLDLRGQDDVDVGPGVEAEFAVRFHLHPDVQVETSARHDEIVFRVGDGSRWRFVAPGESVCIEESIYFAAGDGGRRTCQIVIRGHVLGSATVRWAFRRCPPAA